MHRQSLAAWRSAQLRRPECRSGDLSFGPRFHLRKAAHEPEHPRVVRPRNTEHLSGGSAMSAPSVMRRTMLGMVAGLVLTGNSASAQSANAGSGTAGPVTVDVEALLWWFKGSPTPAPI